MMTVLTVLAVFVPVMLRDIIGWSEGDSILAPGGSISNMYALIIARHKMFPAHKQRGMMALDSQPVCYTSKHVSILYTMHYNIIRTIQ